jgi:hypothetical protein
LHNQFDLAWIRFSPKDRAVELEFTATVPTPELPTAIMLQFLDVDWIQLSPHTLSAGSGDILELGYKEPSDTDHDWLLREEQASPNAHFFLRLAGDEFVRLHARRAKAILGVD